MALTIVGTNILKVTGTTAAAQKVYERSDGSGVRVKAVYWYNITAAGDKLNLIDSKGNDIIPIIAEANASSLFFPIDTFVPDIYCDDMDSGTLYIYIR